MSPRIYSDAPAPGEDADATFDRTLQPFHRPMTLDDSGRIQTGALQVPVDVGGEGEIALGHALREALQDQEAAVGRRALEECDRFGIESPGPRAAFTKSFGGHQVFDVVAEIAGPDTVPTSKIGES